MNIKSIFLVLSTLGLMLFSIGCIDRGSPWFKKISEQEENKSTARSKKRIEEDVKLTELDRLCRSVPILNEHEPIRVSVWGESNQLSYYYHIDIENNFWPSMIEQVKNDGWNYKGRDDGIWEERARFTRHGIAFSISKGNFGRTNIATNCKYENGESY